jgi:hypothetical protein
VWLIVPNQSTESDCAAEPSASKLDLKPPSPDIAQSVWWSAKLRSPAAWRSALKKDRSLNSLGGMTLEPSTAARGVESFISSLRASLASPSPSPESAKGKKMRGGSGRISRESSAKLSPSSSFSKTSPGFSSQPIAILTDGTWKIPQLTLLGDSEPYSQTWPNSGFMRNGCAYARPTWVPRMGGNESSFWPTGTAHDSGGLRGNTMADHHYKPHDLANMAHEWQTPATDSFRSRGGDRKDEQGLDQQARLWATPMSRDTRSGETIADYGNARPLNEQAAQWGTPMASDRSHSSREVDHGIQIANQAEHWHTPHGQGNMDKTGKQGGAGGGEATPRAEDGESAGNHPNASDSLTGQSRSWESLPPDQTIPAGKLCWCGSPGCALRTHKRKLNPIFETLLMGWPILWLLSVPAHCGRLEMASYLFRLRSALRFYCGE